MSLSLWTAHFYILVHDYNRHVREARECRDDSDPGEFANKIVSIYAYSVKSILVTICDLKMQSFLSVSIYRCLSMCSVYYYSADIL
jgi:hypothetical protein